MDEANIGPGDVSALRAQVAHLRAVVAEQGALSFYDVEGERQHTIYLAAAPEYGKQDFTQRLAREIARAKRHYPEARYLGIADGAPSNWSFLEQQTQRQLIDFFHVSEYVGKLAQARYPQRGAEDKRSRWQHEHCRSQPQTRPQSG
jgi:hypothetical protein